MKTPLLLALTFLLALPARPAAPAAVTAPVTARPVAPAEAARGPEWSAVGTSVKVELTAAAAGEHALLLDAATSNRRCRLDVTAGAAKLGADLAPDARQHFLGRLPLAAGRNEVTLTLGWREEGVGGVLADVGPLTAVPTAGLPAAGPAAPVGLMVPLFHKWQMERGPALVDRAAELGARRVQFVIALQARLDANFRVLEYGLVLEDAASPGGSRLFPMDDAVRERLKGWLRPAFARAVQNDLPIGVLLHLNAHGDIQEWRNNFDFDPVRPVAGWSYERAFALAVVEALEESVPQDWPVEFSVQGEMGTTVMRYPDSWSTLVKRLRQRNVLYNSKYGISLNHEAVAGKARPREVSAMQVNRLLGLVDFVGVSMYQRMGVPPTARDFAANVERFAAEFAALGAPLPPGKPLPFVEVGLGGGGLSPEGSFSVPAKEVAHAARAPFQGTAEKDKNPWTRPEFTAYRRAYHDALLDFLRTQPARWPVPAATLWNFGSWDPLGVDGADFADAEIVKRVQEHNRRLTP